MKRICADALNCLGQGFDLLWDKLSSGLPTFIVALLMIVIGFVVAMWLGDFIGGLIKKSGIDKPVESALTPISKLVDSKINASKLIGETVKWVLLITVLIATFKMLKLFAVIDFFTQALLYVPSIFVAVFIMIVGYLLASFIADIISLLTKKEQAYLPKAARTAIFLLAAIVSLSIAVTPLVVAFAQFLNGLPISDSKINAIFIGLVVLLAYGARNVVTKKIEKLLEDL